eukprot:6187089-Pleurochrysis_carterae.AAC.5
MGPAGAVSKTLCVTQPGYEGRGRYGGNANARRACARRMQCRTRASDTNACSRHDRCTLRITKSVREN